jgi:hypothetical protein
MFSYTTENQIEKRFKDSIHYAIQRHPEGKVNNPKMYTKVIDICGNCDFVISEYFNGHLKNLYCHFTKSIIKNRGDCMLEDCPLNKYKETL